MSAGSWSGTTIAVMIIAIGAAAISTDFNFLAMLIAAVLGGLGWTLWSAFFYGRRQT
jgi:hypothetical protein